MPLDPQVKAILDQLAENPPPPMDQTTPEEARAFYRAMGALTDPQDVPIGKTSDAAVPGPAGDIPVRIYKPVAAGGEALPCLIYYHGGGFVIGDLETHDKLCRMLANESDCVVVAVDYRLAPEHKFPAAVEDAYAAARYVEENAEEFGVDPNRLAVGGDSAGGNLAAVVALMAKEKGAPTLRFQLLIYPTVSGNEETPSVRENGEGYLLEKRTMDWFFAQYTDSPGQKDDPRLAPLRAGDLEGLPPAFVITAGYDPLRDEGLQYADKLRAAGVKTDYKNYDSMVHGFFTMAGILDLSKEAIAEAGDKLKTALAE